MQDTLLRTYRRREVTRQSGFHVCDETTGAECIYKYSEQIEINKDTKLIFQRKRIELVNLFLKNYSILAFGGCIISDKNIDIYPTFLYEQDSRKIKKEFSKIEILQNKWTNFGNHIKIESNDDLDFIDNIYLVLEIKCSSSTKINFASFDFNIINKEEFVNTDLEVQFNQKTKMIIPSMVTSTLSISKANCNKSLNNF